MDEQKMNENIKVVVDADAIVAQAHHQDANHAKAVQISQKLKEINAHINDF